MSHEFEYLEDKSITLIKISGTYNFAMETDFLKEMISIIKEHNSKGSLWDCREGEFVGDTATLYDRPKLYEHLDMHRARRRALVVKELNQDLQFFENVCVNRGWSIKLFIDYDAAIKWLTE